MGAVHLCMEQRHQDRWHFMHLQEWLDTENVVIGTKCNRLLLLNTTTRKVRLPHPAMPVSLQMLLTRLS